MRKLFWVLGAVILSAGGAYLGFAQGQPAGSRLSFFITSVGPGDGANLGGLAGADRHCQMLAASVGAGQRMWRAYLSTQGPQAVNARDRIGAGPWLNARGVMVARNPDDLHSPSNNVNKMTALTERGQIVNGFGDRPNTHDMITGSMPDGRAFPVSAGDQTCRGFTSNGPGTVRLGHHDRRGGGDMPNSWNSAHPSIGCAQRQLVASGGNGLFYCFAAD